MRPLKQINEEYEALDDRDWNKDYKLDQVQRATLSEEFKGIVLFEFEPLVKECIEKAPETFIITLHSGDRFIYYSSKATLVPLYKKGKKGVPMFIPPHSFMKYFSFINTSNNE